MFVLELLLVVILLVLLFVVLVELTVVCLLDDAVIVDEEDGEEDDGLPFWLVMLFTNCSMRYTAALFVPTSEFKCVPWWF